jgi:hypothetical protein
MGATQGETEGGMRVGGGSNGVTRTREPKSAREEGIEKREKAEGANAGEVKSITRTQGVCVVDAHCKVST